MSRLWDNYGLTFQGIKKQITTINTAPITAKQETEIKITAKKTKEDGTTRPATAAATAERKRIDVDQNFTAASRRRIENTGHRNSATKGVIRTQITAAPN